MAASTHANRGKWLERAVEETCRTYRLRGTACVQKVATPYAMPMERDGERHFIRKRSTVDFVGVCKGLAVAFDAKGTKQQSLPLKNVHEHQLQFLESFARAGGVGFLLVGFERRGASLGEALYACTPRWWRQAQQEHEGRKSIPRAAFEAAQSSLTQECIYIPVGRSAVAIDFAPAVVELLGRACRACEQPHPVAQV